MGRVVTLAHGGGGKETSEIIEKLIAPSFKYKRVADGIGLEELDDGASIPVGGVHVVVSTDSYTVNPYRFPGGDIGLLAVCGAINDVAVMGAEPVAIMDCIVAEEGFPLEELHSIIESMAKVAAEEKVALIGGDFKVMPRGSVDKILISTTGIGVAKPWELLRLSNAKPGDKVIVTGTIGEHGAAVLAAQLGMESDEIRSDVAPIARAIRAAKRVGGLHAAKDPTRGGLAAALNEIARASRVSIKVYEEHIPVREPVKGLAEMLGVDVLSLACEGRALLVVDGEKAEEVVKALKREGYRDASIIGEVGDEKPGLVLLETLTGGLRILDMPSGEIVPRIC